MLCELNASLRYFMSLYIKPVMEIRGEDIIESFIRENSDKFVVEDLPENHAERFLFKLNKKIRHLVSIVPYLVKVTIATLFIFAASIMIWNNYIRKDRHEITLRNKISLVINKITKY